MVEKKLIAYTVVERKSDGKKLWVRIGDGFRQRDGAIEMQLDALPTNGTIVVRDAAALGERAASMTTGPAPGPDEHHFTPETVEEPEDQLEVAPFIAAFTWVLARASRKRELFAEALKMLALSERETYERALTVSPFLGDFVSAVSDAFDDLVRAAEGKAAVVAPARVASMRTQIGSIRMCAGDLVTPEGQRSEHARDMLESAISHLESTFASTFPEDGRPAAVGLPRPKIRAKLAPQIVSRLLQSLKDLGPATFRERRSDLIEIVEQEIKAYDNG